MIENDWLTADLKGSVIVLTAYPKSHNKYERKIDLKKLYPGAYGGQKSWDETPPLVEFDRGLGLLTVGTQPKLDDRNHIDVSEYLFTD
jgi:hypothetical protein